MEWSQCRRPNRLWIVISILCSFTSDLCYRAVDSGTLAYLEQMEPAAMSGSALMEFGTGTGWVEP